MTNVPISGVATATDGTVYTLGGTVTVTATAPPPPPPPPPPPTALPIMGFNDKVDGGILKVATTLSCTKPIPGAKMFDTAIPSTFPLPTTTTTWPLLCLKPALPLSSGDQAALANLAKLAAAAAPNAMITLYQEGEHSGISASVLKQAHAQAYAIVHKAAPTVRYGQCLMSYSASGKSSYGPLSGWVATQTGGAGLDFYGFDTYPWASTVSAGTVLDACLAELKTVVVNPTVAVTELNYTSNIATAPIYAGGGAQWFAEAWSWATANKALLFYVFAATARGVPWPPDAATIAELAKIAAAAGI